MTVFKNQVVLIEDGHLYKDKKGNILHLPSVTTLINMLYPFKTENIDLQLLRQGISRGNCLHRRMEYLIKYNLEIPCRCQYGKKTHDFNFEWTKEKYYFLISKYEIVEVYSELSLYSETYTGTIDLLMKTKNDEWIIIDLKTTNWKIQDQEGRKIIVRKEALQCEFYIKLCPKDFNFIHRIIINPTARKMYSISLKEQNQANVDYSVIIERLKVETK